MSTGNLNLDLILGKIAEDSISGRRTSVSALKKQFPALSDREVDDLFKMFQDALTEGREERATLVALELRKAHETFEEIEILTSANRWSGAAKLLFFKS